MHEVSARTVLSSSVTSGQNYLDFHTLPRSYLPRERQNRRGGRLRCVHDGTRRGRCTVSTRTTEGIRLTRTAPTQVLKPLVSLLGRRGEPPHGARRNTGGMSRPATLRSTSVSVRFCAVFKLIPYRYLRAESFVMNLAGGRIAFRFPRLPRLGTMRDDNFTGPVTDTVPPRREAREFRSRVSLVCRSRKDDDGPRCDGRRKCRGNVSVSYRNSDDDVSLALGVRGSGDLSRELRRSTEGQTGACGNHFSDAFL